MSSIAMNSKEKKKWIFESKWLIFYWGWHFDITYSTCGYFDARHRINFDLIFFSLTLILPIYSKHTDECDPPEWGIKYHNQTFWIELGGQGNGTNKNYTIYMPWQFQWVRTSNLRKDGKWEHETKGNRKDFWKEEEWEEVLWSESHPYTYKLESGGIQERIAKISVSEREWRWHWFKWLPFPRKVSRTLDIDFNDEVGPQTGSWKGGVVGCSYELLLGESPLVCLRRMEKEIEFK